MTKLYFYKHGPCMVYKTLWSILYGPHDMICKLLPFFELQLDEILSSPCDTMGYQSVHRKYRLLQHRPFIQLTNKFVAQSWSAYALGFSVQDNHNRALHGFWGLFKLTAL